MPSSAQANPNVLKKPYHRHAPYFQVSRLAADLLGQSLSSWEEQTDSYSVALTSPLKTARQPIHGGSKAPGKPSRACMPAKQMPHLILSCSRLCLSFSFSACSAWAFKAFSRSSFSRAALLNCSKLSLLAFTVEDGAVGCFCTRLAQEPMFFIFRSCGESKCIIKAQQRSLCNHQGQHE